MYIGDCMSSTTIRLDVSLKNELSKMKNFERESYEDVIERLVEIAKEDDFLYPEEIKQIEEALADLKKGNVLPLDEAEKKWGI